MAGFINEDMILPLDSRLEPEVFADRLAKIESEPRLMRAEWGRCALEPWYWLVNYVWTIRKDEFSEGVKPEILRFPPKEHLRYIFHLCFSEPKLAVDKSRQMTLSWLFMAYELHRCQFGDHEDIWVQTKKEQDAADLIDRARFMLLNERRWLRPGWNPKTHYRGGKAGRLVIPFTHGKISGLPGGPGAGDQIRSKNPSRYVIDEGAFLEEFEDCRTNGEACCQDIKIVSTAQVGEFARFVQVEQDGMRWAA